MSTSHLSLSFTVTAILNSISSHLSTNETYTGLSDLPDPAREALEVASLLVGDELVGEAIRLIEEGRITEYRLSTPTTGSGGQSSGGGERNIFSIKPPPNHSTKSSHMGPHIVRLHAWHCDCFEFVVSEAAERPTAHKASYPYSEGKMEWCWGGYCSGILDTSPPVCSHLVACSIIAAAPGIAGSRLKTVELDRFGVAMLGAGQLPPASVEENTKTR